MRPQAFASVIVNTSVVASKGMENAGIYAATKAAVCSFARTAAAELRGRNIRVNAVAPGPIATAIFGRSGLTEEQIEGFKAGISERVPMRSIGRPEEIDERPQRPGQESSMRFPAERRWRRRSCKR